MTVSFLPRSQALKPRATLLCFSHLRWDFVWQRPQHLLSRAVAEYDVFFVEEPVFDAGGDPEFVVRGTDCGVQVAHLRVQKGTPAAVVDRETARHVRRLAPPDKRLVLWFYTPMAQRHAEGLTADLVVFDCMDDLKSFAGAPPEMAAMEDQLLGRAHVVLTGGRTLFETRRFRHPNVHLFPSSIDATHFGQARLPGPEPSDQQEIPRPRIGFFGVIDERMNLELVTGIALLRPDWHLVMIGPTAKIDPRDLPRLPNIHWLGPKSYADLPAYLRNWDAGFMPFAMNEATRHISPTKTPEFLAAGLSLVSTPIADVMADYGAVVVFATEPQQFVTKLDAAMKTQSPEHEAQIQTLLARSSWDGVWAGISELIQPLQEPAARAAGAGHA